MTTKEVAETYYEMVKSGRAHEIVGLLYSPDIESFEPVNNSNVPLKTKGLHEYRLKEKNFEDLIENRFGGTITEPIISSFHFACSMGMDVQYKGGNRVYKQEIGVFEVENGKIFREHWFYNDFKL